MSTIGKKYYREYPSGKLSTGDIFTNLPTMGLLKQPFSSGVIITPACDLYNSKTSIITYLPIISVEEYLCSIEFLPRIKTILHSHFNALNIKDSDLLNEQVFDQDCLELLRENCKKKEFKKLKEIERQREVFSGLTLLEFIMSEKQKVPSDLIKSFTDKVSKEKIIGGLITNYHMDYHFFPLDTKDAQQSLAFSNHSIALLRYPITVPFEILNKAKDLNVEHSDNWNNFIRNSSSKIVCYSSFEKLPLRALRLKQEYLSDLLSRFIAIFVRMGSPDLQSLEVERIHKDINL